VETETTRGTGTPELAVAMLFLSFGLVEVWA
jgi:hypothetical protein